MKTFILNVALLLALQVSISGCTEWEFDLPNNFGSGWSNSCCVGGTYDFGYAASFWLDSVVGVSDSKVTIWAHIRYDSMLIINSRRINYSDAMGNGETFTEMIQSEPDTINFTQLSDSTTDFMGRKEWIYKYAISVDSLKSNIDYTFCVINEYKEKTELKTAEVCTTFLQ